MSALAGLLGERVTIAARDDARDAGGGAIGGWGEVARIWAQVSPDGFVDEGGRARPRWRVTLRTRALSVDERIEWRGGVLRIVGVSRDPARRDRIVVRAVEQD